MNKDEMTPVEANDAEPVVNIHKETYEWIQCLVVALLCCVIIFMFVARVIDVKGKSMEPTLYEGDKIVITRLAGDYERGDIVVLRVETFREEPLVKRIIALGGETIDIDFDAGIVYIDGVALDEPYVNELTYDPEDFEGPVEVPEGCVFVMGDNRNNSSDSRKATISCVDERLLLGKAVFRIWPFSKFGAMNGWDY